MIEFEMKFQISDFENIRIILLENSGRKLKIENQHDLYFNHPTRDFAQTDEALRLRFIENKVELTYKGPKISKSSKSRLEINSQLMDTNVIEILKYLGFKKSGEVYKKREIWELNNLDRSVTVSLDTIKGLGKFVELEIIGNSEVEYQETLGKIKQIATMLNLKVDDQIRISYLELLMSK